MARRPRGAPAPRARGLDGGDGRGRGRPLHPADRARDDLRRPRRGTPQGHGLAGRGCHGRAPVLAPAELAWRLSRAGADGHPGHRPRSPAPVDSRVSRGHLDPRAHDARPRPGLHVEQPARREDGLAGQAVRRPGPRTQQPGFGHRAQRGASPGAPGGCGAGDARAGRRAAHRFAARGHRCRAGRLPRQAGAGRAVADPAGRARRCDRRLARGTRHQRGHRRAAGRHRRHARRARPDRGGGSRRGPRGRPSLDGRRLFGARDRVGDPGRGDADRRSGAGDQGIHAHGPGARRRARRPGVEPGQHRHRAQVEGAHEIGGRGRAGRARPSARARLRRRAEPDLGEPDRQRARRRSRRRPRRGDGRARAGARRRARRRQRTGDSARGPRRICSSRSSRPSRSGRARASASTSSGAWSTTTTPRSTSSRDRDERSSASRCRSPTPTGPEDGREQARPPRRGRRSAGARRGAARSARAIPGVLHGRQRLVGRGGARDDPRTEGPGRRAGDGDQRPADAGHPGHRGAGAVPRDLPAGAARAADGLLGHRRGDQGHQRGASRSLPLEAVGSARGAPLPDRGRPARRLAGRRIFPKPRACGWSGTSGRRGRTRSRTSWRAISFPIAGSTSSATRTRASCWTRPA